MRLTDTTDFIDFYITQRERDEFMRMNPSWYTLKNYVTLTADKAHVVFIHLLMSFIRMPSILYTFEGSAFHAICV